MPLFPSGHPSLLPPHSPLTCSVQVCFCFAQSVASTRFMIQDELRIQTTKCDNCIIGTMIVSARQRGPQHPDRVLRSCNVACLFPPHGTAPE